MGRRRVLLKKSIIVLLMLAALFLVSLLFVGGSKPSGKLVSSNLRLKGEVYFFYGLTCPHCIRVQPLIDEVEQSYGLKVQRFEVYSNRSNLLLLQDYFEKYNVSMVDRGIPAVFVSGSYLVGDTDILGGFKNLVANSLSVDSTNSQVLNSTVTENCSVEKASSLDCLSLLSITAAALVDSVNPCSIGILLFLLTGLLLFNRRGKALKAGIVFSLSVFAANLVFGLGLLTIIVASGLVLVLKVAAGSIALLAGVLFLKEYFFYGRGGFVMEVPRFLRPCLKDKLRKAFFGKSAGILGAFLAGFLVTSFEVPCTGGPYFYVLARMADQSLRMQTLPVLLFYNLIFVMPLVLISFLLYFGSVHVEKIREWKDGNKRLLNLARGLPMVGVALITIPASLTVQAVLGFFNVYRTTFLPLSGFTAFFIVFQALSKSKNRLKVVKCLFVFCIALTMMASILFRPVEAPMLGRPMFYSGEPLGFGWSQSCVVISVRFYDGTPIEGANVYANSIFLGTTNANGQIKICGLLTQGNYILKAYYGGNQYGKDTALTVNPDGSGSAVIDGKGCMTFLSDPPVSELDTIYVPADPGICPPYWGIGPTNSKGVAQNCNGLVIPGDYVGELYTTSCWGGNYAFRVYSDYSGFVKIPNNGYCICSSI